MQHQKKLDTKDYSFAHLTLIVSLHYVLKCRSRSLAVYNNEFILGSAIMLRLRKLLKPQNYFKSCYYLTLIVFVLT